MRTLLLLLIPVALLLAFGGGVLFWAAFSQIRFLSYFRHQEKRPPALGLRGWLALYWQTLVGGYKLLWWVFRAAFHAGLRQPAGETTGRPVLCVHGLFLNSTCMWGIRRRLEGMGRPTRGVFMGAPLPSPMSYARPLARVMKELAASFPEEGFDVVAHSLGGIMTREVLRRHPELADSVHSIVTLGSPHHGTAVLRWLRHGPIYKMLARDSEYMENLGDFRTLAPASRVTTVAAHHDLVVYPLATAHLAGARQVTLSGVNHLGLTTDSRSFDEVAEALTESDGHGE